MNPKLEKIENFPYPYFQYGSENSTDLDVIISIPAEHMPNSQEERKRFVKSLTSEFEVNWNSTLAVFKAGQMVDTIYTKAWIDSLNNAFLTTYTNHRQFWEIPVKSMIPRNKTLAIYKAVRTVLTMLARTRLRPEIKPILKGIHPFKLKLEKLKEVDFSKFREFNQLNGSDEDVWKIIAFYIGQNLELIRGESEIYTKDKLVASLPKLGPFIRRELIEKADKEYLTGLKNEWFKSINDFGDFKSVNHFLHCNDEIIDMKNEKY